MSEPKQEFDVETHTYRIDGRTVPSVTDVVRAVLPGWQASEWHMQRGTAMHHACRLSDEGRLNRESVAPEIAGRLEAWEKFRADAFKVWPPAVRFIEHRMFNIPWRFAGTTDRVFGWEDTNVVIDLKSTVEPQVRLQLGGYSILWNNQPSRPRRADRAAAVELREDATYRVLWLNKTDLRRAEASFLSALNVYGFMKEHNLLKGEK